MFFVTKKKIFFSFFTFYLTYICSTYTIFALSPQTKIKKNENLNFAEAYTFNEYIRNRSAFLYIDGQIFKQNKKKQLEYSVVEYHNSYELMLHDIIKPQFSLKATLKNNNLDLIILTREVKNGVEIDRSSWRGNELFDLAIHFFNKKIKTITGYWSNEHLPHLNDNLQTVNILMRAGISFEEAITKTWTSKKGSFRNNFRKIVYQKNKIIGTPGYLTTIEIKYYPSKNIEVSC